MKVREVSMKIKELRNNALKLSLILIVAGLLIAFIGFAISGFDVDAFRWNGENNVFRTINF